MTAPRTKSATDTAVKERVRTKEPPRYKVILLNDNYTTMEFVIMVLEAVFNKSSAEAQKTMLAVHKDGAGLAGVYTKEIAETKVAIVHNLARQNEYPLKCKVEPE